MQPPGIIHTDAFLTIGAKRYRVRDGAGCLTTVFVAVKVDRLILADSQALDVDISLERVPVDLETDVLLERLRGNKAALCSQLLEGGH